MILSLYTSALIGIHFGQAANINFMVSKAVNSSFFMILGSNFNENEFKRNTSFKFCLSLGLINTFDGHSLIKASTWSNFRGVERVINFIFINENLVSAITLHKVNDVSEFFNTDYKSVLVLISLNELLDAHLISTCKQANQDQLKFKLRDTDDIQ
ncbi:hypothetical protein G9A89_015901 [Geosiphon pyriformis]|nr:hypothetical protein G9A89_015901 [Geosiphon pyriformis]